MRHAELSLEYEGHSITTDVQDDLLSFQYDEKASGEADSLSISLQDKTRKWLFGWFPRSGDIIRPKLTTYDWAKKGEIKTLDCGRMPIDEPQFSGPPGTFTLKALSIPSADGFNDAPEDYTWQNISMSQLGSEIASKYGLQFIYDAPCDFIISTLKRSNQTDSDLLSSTAQKYNLCTKIFNGKLVIYDKATYEAKAPVASIIYGQSNISQYDLAAPTVDTNYAGVVETYSLPDNDNPFTYSFRVANSGKMLTINESVDDTAQAEMVAKSNLREKNEKRMTGNFTLALNLGIVAAETVQLIGWGNFDGKYFVDSASHSYSSSSGQTQIEVHKCLEGGY